MGASCGRPIVGPLHWVAYCCELYVRLPDEFSTGRKVYFTKSKVEFSSPMQKQSSALKNCSPYRAPLKGYSVKKPIFLLLLLWAY